MNVQNKLSILLLVMSILALTGCAEKAPGSDAEKLPDFTLSDLAGRQVSLQSFEGKKIVVLNFWATWCGPCRHEIPDFNAAYESYKNRGVEFLGVSADQNAEEVVPSFVDEIPIAYPVLLGSPELAFKYGIRGFPTTYIIGKTGAVHRRFIGMINRQTLEDELNKLL
jgi:thiol-disulfide isomerase/thioredoxin